MHSSIAQSVEHLTVNQGVTGSSPVGGVNIGYSIVSDILVRVINAEGPPVPIPNTEVKLCRAEDT